MHKKGPCLERDGKAGSHNAVPVPRSGITITLHMQASGRTARTEDYIDGSHL